jgi:hypothetical protein
MTNYSQVKKNKPLKPKKLIKITTNLGKKKIFLKKYP